MFGNVNVNKNIITNFDSAWKNNKNVSPIEVASALRGASAAAIENEKRGKTEIVWTGPSIDQIPVRQTEQVLCEIINSAKRNLFIVSFVAYEIDSIVKAIRNAMGRNVQINMILEQPIEHGGRVSQDSIKMIKRLFPSITIYSWTRNPTTTNNLGAIHAKCVVADSELAFITSANLTSAAMERNIELGVLIRGGTLPIELHNHLESLITAKILEKI